MSLQLKESLKLYTESNADHKWIQTTSITKASTSGRSMLHFVAELPLDGSNKGYFVRIKDSNGDVVPNTYHEGAATSNPVKGTITSDYLDFRSQIYTVEFGPHFLDSKVNAVGATVKMIQGRPRKFESSAVYHDGNQQKTVDFSYNVPPSIFDSNTKVKIYLVEGDTIQQESKAIERKTFNVSQSSYIGDGKINFDKPLKTNGTYTLCMGIYSTVRQIAGYTFKWE